jgi:23S rRNA (uracil1939-C5)-methyltransferase
LDILDQASTVIVDPPRKGLDRKFLQGLEEAKNAKQLLYVSCGWDSFKRDYQELRSAGWEVRSVDGYLFFAGSNHVEVLADFVRTEKIFS